MVTGAITRTPILGRGSGAGPWGVGKWLASTPTRSHRPSVGRRLDAGVSVSPPLVDRQGLLHPPRQTPAVMPVLRKLESLLPQFCQNMAECRFLKCCTALGSTLLAPPLSGPRPRSSNSPVSSLLGGAASPLSRASPGRSPIRAWLTGASGGAGGGDYTTTTRNDSSNSLDELHTATMLESNMEVFFLLLGAESMYRSMAHVMSPHFAQIMASSFEQALKDLQLLRFSLCEAFHVRPEADTRPSLLLSSSSQEEASKAKTTHTTTLSVEDTVKDLATSLLLLVSFCQARIQCIHLQAAMWHPPPHSTATPNFAELAAAFATIAPTTRLDLVQEKQNHNASLSLKPVETLLLLTVDEIDAWSALCRTTFAVQHCQFAESILAAQATKAKLQRLGKINHNSAKDPKKASCLEQWLQETLRAIVGTFPIVFDKAAAFAKPLYGFDVEMDTLASSTTTTTTTPGSPTEDMAPLTRNNTVSESFENDVMDALHKYVRVGAISIAVVLDAVRTSNPRVESGFAPFDRTSIDAHVDTEATSRKQYPAIYIRTLSAMTTTTRPFEAGSPRPSPPSSMGGHKSPLSTMNNNHNHSESGLMAVGRVMRRENSRKDRFTHNPTTSPLTPTSNRKAFRSWSTEDSAQKLAPHATSPSHRKGANKAMYALEYGASDEGSEHSKQSWPHSEWSTLVAVITDSTNNNNNNNNRALGDVDTLRGLTSLFGGAQGIQPFEGLDTRAVASGPRVSYGQQSIHCIESISDSMWLVAILKDLDQPTGRWQWQSPRPTTERMEDDLRDLVSNLASMLRISDRFDAPSVRLLREKFLERSSDDEIGAGLAEELNERGIDLTEMGAEKIAIWIKNQLKVLAQSSNTSRNGASLGTTSRLLRRKLRRRGTKPLEVGHAESAAAFFLGKDLMHTIVFDFY